jgi:hypothetical protein
MMNALSTTPNAINKTAPTGAVRAGRSIMSAQATPMRNPKAATKARPRVSAFTRIGPGCSDMATKTRPASAAEAPANATKYDCHSCKMTWSAMIVPSCHPHSLECRPELSASRSASEETPSQYTTDKPRSVTLWVAANSPREGADVLAHHPHARRSYCVRAGCAILSLSRAVGLLALA